MADDSNLRDLLGLGDTEPDVDSPEKIIRDLQTQVAGLQREIERYKAHFGELPDA